jgi:hypothetical protein
VEKDLVIPKGIDNFLRLENFVIKDKTKALALSIMI